MTVKISRQRRGDSGCVSSKSSTSDCSPKHSNQADRSSVSKSPYLNPSRRQSPRLKVIKAVYKADDASYSNLHQQSSGDDQNFENSTLEQDHKSGNKHLKNCGEEERITDPDDLIIGDITLKDIQTRCKARKRKTLKTVASSAFDLSDHRFLKPKEEEPDLNEPLISLRSKLSNKSLIEKRKKCSHPSESFFPVEKTAAQPSTELKAHCSSSIETDKFSVEKEFIGANVSSSTDRNTGVISLKDPLHAGSSHLIYDVKSEIVDNCLCDMQKIDDGAVSSTMVYDEIAANCLVDMQRMDDGAVSSTLVYDESCNVLDNSSAELLQNVSEGKSGNGDPCCFIRDVHNPGVIDHIDMAICNSTHSLSVMGANIQVDRSEPAYVQSETSEAETQVFENTIYVSDSPTADFIAKFSYSGYSSNQLVEKVGGYSMSGGSTYLTTTNEPLPYPVNEDSSGLKDDNYTNLSECTEEHFGEIREESSHQSFLKVSPSPSRSKIPFSCVDGSCLVLATMVLTSDACDAIENQTTPQEEIKDRNATNGENYSAPTDSQESMSVNYVRESNMNNELSNQVDEATEKMQTCSLQDSVTIEHDLLCGEKNDLKMAFYNKSDGDCLDNLILETFAGDPLSKGNKDDKVSQAEECSSGETYNVCPPPHSHTYFSSFYDLHGVDESSSKNEVYSSTLEQMVNGYREKATSQLIDYSSSPEEATETLGHSPPVSPPCRSEINDLHNVEDSLCKAAEHLLPSAAEENLKPAAGVQNYPSTGTPYSIYDRESTEKKIECDQDVRVELHPKKLLSNRKDLSPTSKEMLLQALNGSPLYDTKQTFGYGETEVMLSSSRLMKRKKSTHLLDYGEPEVLMRSNRMMKRTRSDADVSLPPVTRGILRSPDKSENTLIHTQAQKAITFSQRQMQDVENIATKLLRELKSMKNIVEGTLSSEECPLAPPKYTPEEIRTATQSVSALEATTRKWLSMMAKDCNRFCKIMKSTENKVGAPVNGPRKQRKKITFADEAGGLLCHVKIFEQQPDSLEVPISEG